MTMQGRNLRCRIGRRVVVAIMCMFAAVPALAQSAKLPELDTLLQRTIVVGTKEAPPFAMKTREGEWSGISIDLWRRIADEKNGAIGLSRCKQSPN
jgi:ABC-type amino acid transport substrate-binding protein